MSQYLNRVRDVDPNDSEAVKEALTAFFQNLPKHKGVDCNRWLRTLENVINRFPKYCGQHRITVENYLNHFLDATNYYNVIEAAKCAQAIQQVRPQQERTASAKSCWRDQMSSLCEAAHTLIDTLFTKSASIYNKNGKSQKNDSQSTSSPLQAALAELDIVTKSNDVANKNDVLCTRLRNVLVFIQAMLVEVYPVAKPVRLQLILEVVLHALSASGTEDSTKVTTVKVQALKTLDAIIAGLGSNLIPYSALVFRFVMQTLKWSLENATQETRKVRCTAYSSLTSWLGCVRAHRAPASSARPWYAELPAHVAADVAPPRHVMQLTPNAQPMKNLSKKARKKLANSLLMQSNIASHMPGEKNKISLSEESNDELAIAALECAEAFMTTCGIFLKPAIHKQFHELLVSECYNLDRYSAERATWLLRALEACRKSSSPLVPPPTQHCLQLYSVLVNNSHAEISKFASQALLDIRLHLHCSPPSLNFALEKQQPENNTVEEKRKLFSDRNRAVLERLLGKARMPSQNVSGVQIIAIPDEPLSKRPRIVEDDRISLSSESGASVIITDTSSIEEVEDLDDSVDYIIEPNPMIMGFPYHGKAQSSQQIDYRQPEEQIDDTDGKLNNDSVDDADTIKLTQSDPNKTKYNLFNAATQLPAASLDSNEENRSPTKSPQIEVGYDYRNTGQKKVTVLEKMDEDNLPSTNDTDDVQITCGQTLKNSQDEIKENETNEVPKENGIAISPQTVIENGDATNAEIEVVASKIAPNDGAVTVEDMMADFVDEVNDENQAQILA